MSTHSDAAPPSEAGPQFKDAIPVLRIFSVEKAKEFYVDFLGFAIDWEHRFGDDLPLYMQVSRSGLRLHLSEHHGDATPGSTVFIWMRGIAALHRELTAKAYRYASPAWKRRPGTPGSWRWPTRSATGCASASRAPPMTRVPEVGCPIWACGSRRGLR